MKNKILIMLYIILVFNLLWADTVSVQKDRKILKMPETDMVSSENEHELIHDSIDKEQIEDFYTDEELKKGTAMDEVDIEYDKDSINVKDDKLTFEEKIVDEDKSGIIEIYDKKDVYSETGIVDYIEDQTLDNNLIRLSPEPILKEFDIDHKKERIIDDVVDTKPNFKTFLRNIKLTAGIFERFGFDYQEGVNYTNNYMFIDYKRLQGSLNPKNSNYSIDDLNFELSHYFTDKIDDFVSVKFGFKNIDNQLPFVNSVDDYVMFDRYIGDVYFKLLKEINEKNLLLKSFYRLNKLTSISTHDNKLLMSNKFHISGKLIENNIFNSINVNSEIYDTDVKDYHKLSVDYFRSERIVLKTDFIGLDIKYDVKLLYFFKSKFDIDLNSTISYLYQDYGLKLKINRNIFIPTLDDYYFSKYYIKFNPNLERETKNSVELVFDYKKKDFKITLVPGFNIIQNRIFLDGDISDSSDTWHLDLNGLYLPRNYINNIYKLIMKIGFEYVFNDNLKFFSDMIFQRWTAKVKMPFESNWKYRTGIKLNSFKGIKGIAVIKYNSDQFYDNVYHDEKIDEFYQIEIDLNKVFYNWLKVGVKYKHILSVNHEFLKKYPVPQKDLTGSITILF